MSTPRIHAIASILVVLALVASACTLGDDDGGVENAADGLSTMTGADPSGETSEPADGSVSEEGGADDREAARDGTATPIAPTGSQISTGRDIVYTASLTIEADDVATATHEAGQIVESLGGMLFGQETTGGPRPRTTLVFRVLPEDFAEALERLGALGTLVDQRVSADDVTERVVDLESRIATASVSVDRLRQLLESATDIEDIATLERQLLQRETDLETLRGQLRTLQDRVDLATITLTIDQLVVSPGISVDVTVYPGTDDAGLSCPGSVELEVDEGTETTVCVDIVNTGDTSLVDLTLSDPVLAVMLEDFSLVSGLDDDALEPGEHLVYQLPITVDETLRLQTRIGAVPVDADGEPLRTENVADTATATVIAVDPGGIPGFGAGVDASWELLQRIGSVIVLAAGAALPFLWLAPVIWLLARWLRRDRSENAPAETEERVEEATEPVGV